MKSFIAVVRQTAGGKGYKTAKETSWHWKPSPRVVSIQPECSLSNAPSYLRLYPRRYSQALMYGSSSSFPTSVTLPMFQETLLKDAPTSSSGHLLQSRMFSHSTQSSDQQNNNKEGHMPTPQEGEETLSLYSSGAESSSPKSFSSSPTPSSQQSEYDQKRAKLAKGKMSVLKLQSKLKAKIPVTVLTAYDTPSARLADEAGIDMILIGDSVGMVALGEPNTVSVTMDTMVHHCKAVTAAKPKHSMVVGDMPFGSYLTVEDALANAARLMKEGKVDAVKLEGGKRIQPIVEALVSAGIVVVGHVGLCPQSAAAVGGFRVQGKTVGAAKQIIEDANAMEEAGVCACVLEMVPREVGELVSSSLNIPTIGIGAGSGCGGQVLVWHDLLGLYPNPPKFVKQMANVGEIIRDALTNYVEEVETRTFPAPEHSSSLTPSVLEELKSHFGEDHFASSFPTPPSSPSSPSSPPPSPPTPSSPLTSIPPSSVFPSSPESAPLSASYHSSSPSCPSPAEIEHFLEKSPVVVIGGGSMGSLFSSRLSRLVPVLLLSSHSSHVASIQHGGLEYESLGGEEEREEVKGRKGEIMAIDPSMLSSEGLGKGAAKIVFVLTSGEKTEKASSVASWVVDEREGVVVTLQNGLGNEGILEKEVGGGKVMVGVTSQSAILSEPGRVKHTGTQGMTTLLPSSPQQYRQATFISSLLSLAGFPVTIENDEKRGEKMRWKKLATNCIINPLTSLLSVPNGGLLEEASALSLLPLLANEISEVAGKAKNVDLPANEILDEVKHVARVTSLNRSSMRRAMEEGREVEIDQINGSVVRLGEGCGVDTPFNSLLHTLVQNRTKLPSSSSSLLSSIPPPTSSPLSQQSRMFSSLSELDTDIPIFSTPASLRAHRASLSPSLPVAFVPTMGGLHEGHLDLIRHANSMNGSTLVSIFVNPKQFAEGEDFGEYPRTVAEDLKKLEEVGGVGGVFLPKVEDVYGPSFRTFVDIDGVDGMEGEGERRPGFFRGVSTVCTILMNLVRPDVAVFGQKDGLQCLVLKQITRDLQMGVDIHVVRTRREETGLAMSTRNGYLSPEERQQIAPLIYKSLQSVEEVGRREGGISLERVREVMEEGLSSSTLDLEYVTLTDWETGTPITDPSLSLRVSSSSSPSSLLVGDKKVMVAVAAKLGSTRLLDNLLL